MLVKLDSLEGCILTRDFLKYIAMISGGLYVMIHLAVLMLELYADSLVMIHTMTMIICLCKWIKLNLMYVYTSLVWISFSDQW